MSNYIEADANKDYVEGYDCIGGHHVDEYDTDDDGQDSNYMVAEQLLWPRGHWPHLSSNAIVDSRLHRTLYCTALPIVHCVSYNALCIALHCPLCSVQCNHPGRWLLSS